MSSTSWEHEKRSLLPLESSSPTRAGSDSDSDIECEERGRRKLPKLVQLHPSAKKMAYRRHRSQVFRGVWRIIRLLSCVLLLPLLFIMLYMPMYFTVPTRQAALPDWGYNTSRNIADYVLPDNETTIIEPRNICRDKIFLLIIVCSAVHNFAIRQMIRETWGNTTEFNYSMFSQMHSHLQGHYLPPLKQRLQYYSEYLNMSENQRTIPSTVPVRVAFLIGRNKDGMDANDDIAARIHNESLLYDDIVQENFIDSYNNLTLKSIMALKWLSRRNCIQNTAFLMKCDDDTFVNVPNLLHILLGGTIPLYNDTLNSHDTHTYQTLANYNRINSTSELLMGHLFCTARPVANVTSKWYMPYYMYPGEKYPKYLSGAGYVMSTDVVPRLYDAALNASFIYMEDVYVTGICAERMKLKRRHHPLFSYTQPKEMCSFKGSVTQHEIKDDNMIDAYAFVTNMTISCPAPGKYFLQVRLRKNNNCSVS